jgi:hypothetical protein
MSSRLSPAAVSSLSADRRGWTLPKHVSSERSERRLGRLVGAGACFGRATRRGHHPLSLEPPITRTPSRSCGRRSSTPPAARPGSPGSRRWPACPRFVNVCGSFGCPIPLSQVGLPAGGLRARKCSTLLTSLLTKCSQDVGAGDAPGRHCPTRREKKSQIRRYLVTPGSTRHHHSLRLKPLWPQGRAGSTPAPGT